MTAFTRYSGVNEEWRRKKKMVFKAWKESWETRTLKPSGDPIFEARLCRKYGRIEWFHPDNGYAKLMAHPERMWFQKSRGNNHYDVLATMEGYDFSKEPDGQSEMFEAWELSDDFYECVTEYYKQNPDLNVTCYKKGGIVDSHEYETSVQ